MRCYEIWVWLEVRECSRRPIFFFIKENWIYAMTRHHAESNINILLTRNLPIDSGVGQRSHLLTLICVGVESWRSKG